MQKIDIWLMLAREKWPTLSDDRLRALSLEAATDWFSDAPTDLAKLFDQYVMMKQLYGVTEFAPLDVTQGN